MANTKVKKGQIVNVQPLRTHEQIQEFKTAIKHGNKGVPKRLELAERDVLLFLIGINTGLRVSDIVKMKVGDVKGKDAFIINEQKSGKRREVEISMLRKEIDNYTRDKSSYEWLFTSQKGNGHISTTQVYRILQAAADWLGWDFIGTHTMRKTFGYHFYKATKDVATLQEIFNHSAPSITLRYIGITQEEIKERLKEFRLG